MHHPKTAFTSLAAACALIAACGETPAEQEADRMEDQVEMEADQSAYAASNEEAALGMTEEELLDADLLTADGTDLGDIEAVRRDAAGAVTGLVIELEDTDPDRWVEVPMDGLTTRPDGDDMDVQTGMSAEDLSALPDAEMGAMKSPV
ncbi:PRC-barrel domain containing protein [Qipengyuania huizhouensis]|uniref:PRC-barrel domain containing protein n=1 Tax=Qipengyuania huizhouensis TaxID=2867245 RepID=UPI001C868B4D|nr:PRC-barrel domain containing protein [Qipengyuania huizhouensis]MBX7459802.1 PRC-barrel domain containing protein [Qipengyuania huizhouensis]